ncbi:MAG: hypothetical protein HYR55_01450 [Acidobacteria bacterium]|nr:hypothetical protein [Acidobacteriota bacterium]MBI3656009.1 hypothetical protein [Acidobacteriota bacterium]
MKRGILHLALLIVLFSMPAWAQDYDPFAYSSGPFHSCPSIGRGGDPDLNVLKNRDLPPPAFDPMIIDDILGYVPPTASTMGRSVKRADWPQEAWDDVTPWESSGVVIDGYLIGIRSEGPESCNCGSRQYHDYHLWVVANSTDGKPVSVVVEISPRVLASHSTWRQSTLSRLASQRTRVRISGWLMWDEDHPEQIGLSRGTLWEVHPIHKIEYFSGGRWRTL